MEWIVASKLKGEPPVLPDMQKKAALAIDAALAPISEASELRLISRRS